MAGIVMMSLLVPISVLPAVEKRLTRLAKKADVTWSRLPGETTLRVPLEDPDPEAPIPPEFWPTLECARIAIGDMPRIQGWTLVARLQHTEAGVIVACAPGEECPERYREASNICEHCGTKRRRADTFVLRSSEDRLYQIGRNCLADFLQTDPSKLVARAELLAEIAGMCPGEGEPSYGGGRREWSTAWFLACAVASVRVNGFRKSNELGSTKADATFLAGPCPSNSYETRDSWKAWHDGQPNKADIAEAQAILAWTPTGDSDYVHNLKIALKCAGVDFKRMGIVASAPTAYARELGRIQEKKREAAQPDGGHFGEVGKRGAVTATLLRKVEINGDFGGSSLCCFRTEAGQDLVWFASSTCPRTQDIGTAFNLTGTVKRHETRNGRAQTVLTRCKFEVINDA